MKCPKCMGSDVTAQKTGFGLGKAVAGAVATGGVGLLAGFIGSNKVKLHCLKCGHKWDPATQTKIDQRKRDAIKAQRRKERLAKL